MRLKEIEAVPYSNTHTEVGRYWISAFVRRIGGVDHLFVEHSRRGRRNPIYRLVVEGMTDYRYYIPDKGVWRNGVFPYNLEGTCFWTSDLVHLYETQDAILDFFKKDVGSAFYVVRDALAGIQERKITAAKDRKKDKKREMVEKTPRHTDAFKRFAVGMFRPAFLYYLNQGKGVFVTCSHCGFRTYLGGKQKSPEPGSEGTCPECGTEGTYLRERECEMTHKVKKYCFDVRQYEKKGIVISLVRVTKSYSIGAPERFAFQDVANYYYLPGRRTSEKIFFEVDDVCAEGADREPARFIGCEDGRITGKSRNAPVYGADVIGTLKGNPLRYSGWDSYGKDIVEYMNEYLMHPELEMLAKLGLTMMVDDEIRTGVHRVGMEPGQKPWDALGIDREGFRILREKEGNVAVLKILQEAQKHGVVMSKGDVERVFSEVRIYNHEEFVRIVGGNKMKVGKLLDYLAGQESDFGLYHDYLSMAVTLDINLDRKTALYPKNLQEAHDRLAVLADEEETRAMAEEREKEYPGIRLMYGRLCRTYAYADGMFLIRPARSASEIVFEGARMSHCVGRVESYTKNHAGRSRYILMMRRVAEPDVPYCTVEIDVYGNVMQWYQRGDRNTDEDVIGPWLEKYTEIVEGRLLHGKKTA